MRSDRLNICSPGASLASWNLSQSLIGQGTSRAFTAVEMRRDRGLSVVRELSGHFDTRLVPARCVMRQHHRRMRTIPDGSNDEDLDLLTAIVELVHCEPQLVKTRPLAAKWVERHSARRVQFGIARFRRNAVLPERRQSLIKRLLGPEDDVSESTGRTSKSEHR